MRARRRRPPPPKRWWPSRNLELGAIIKDPDVKDVPWPGALPTNAVLKREDIIGRGVTTTIYERRADHGEPAGAQGRGRRSGGHDSVGHAGGGGARERCSRRGRIRGARHARGRADIRQPAGPEQRDSGQPDAHAAAEHRSAVRRTGFQERQRRQAARRGGGEPAGDAGAGRDAEPGEQPDHHPTGAAQSAGHAGGQDARHGGGGVVRGERARRSAPTRRKYT